MENRIFPRIYILIQELHISVWSLIFISEKNEDDFYCKNFCFIHLFGKWFVFQRLLVYTNLKYFFIFELYLVKSLQCYVGGAFNSNDIDNFKEINCGNGTVCAKFYALFVKDCKDFTRSFIKHKPLISEEWLNI